MNYKAFHLYLVIMKRVLIIAIAFLGLGIVSCQKQEIKPIPQEVSIPEWDRVSDDGDELLIEKDSGNGPAMITDPNNDPDGNGK